MLNDQDAIQYINELCDENKSEIQKSSIGIKYSYSEK